MDLPRSTRILIIADARLHRDALARMLASRGVGVVGTTAAGEALARVCRDQPHVALLDLPPELGLTLVAQLRDTASELKSIVLGVSQESADIVAWAEAGVAGYSTIDDSLADLLATISSVMRGETLCSPRITATLLHRVETLASMASAPAILLASLTEREMQVADLLSDGLSNKEIALCLSIALPTVKAHVHSILGKLNASRRGEAVALMRPTHSVARLGRRNGDRGVSTLRTRST